jgi:hypothetical protein
MNTRLLLASMAGLALILTSLTIELHHRATHPESGPHTPGNPHPTTAHTVSRTAPSRLTAAAVERLLPFTPDQIAEAADLATRFVAAYGTYRYDEAPSAYLQRLTPMMSTQLQPAIDRAAGDPVTLTQRRRTQESSTGQAHPETIRAIGPTSITIVILARQTITTTYATRHDTSRYAATLTRTHDGWSVYALELAATGDIGDPSEGDTP